MEELIERAANDLIGSKYAIALTGAGISTESGIHDFRGPDGIWTKHPEAEMEAYEAYGKLVRDPKHHWEKMLEPGSFYKLFEEIGNANPNRGHLALAELEKAGILKTVITQNVDGLHAKAGSQNVVELHGNIWKLRCTREGTVEEVRDNPLPHIPPVCPNCGSFLRPHIVWFGESLDPVVLDRATDLSESCQVMFVIGTSAVVHPAASLPYAAARAGAKIIEVNLEPTSLTPHANFFFPGKAGEILPVLDRQLRERTKP